MRKQEKDQQPGRAIDTLASLDDNSLAAELVAGRQEALAVLFKRHASVVFRVARGILRDAGEAEEIVQQTFLEAYQHIVEFDSAKGSFVGWLLRRARFRAINRRDHLKAERFYDWQAMDVAIAKIPADEIDSICRQEVEPILQEFLRRLSSRQRKVIELVFFEGRTADEVAVEIQDTVHVVRHLLYKGVDRLRSAAQKRIGKRKRGPIE